MEKLHYKRKTAKFEDLLGLTLSDVTVMQGTDDDFITFKTTCGREFKMKHDNESFEKVFIADITGDMPGLIATPVLLAEVSTNDEPEPKNDAEAMWTFYKLATIKGYVDIRWYGESSGFYSMGVSFYEVVINDGNTKPWPTHQPH